MGLHLVLGYGFTVVAMKKTTATDGLDGLGWADVGACTLPTVERPLRVAEFDDLFVSSLRSIGAREGDTHARLLLSGGAGLIERVQQLAQAESSCCSFFTFEVTPLAEDLVALDVGVPPAYSDVLAGLVDQAARALGRAS